MQLIDVYPEFSLPQIDILHSGAKITLFMAGIGSGKTFQIGMRSGIRITKYPHINGFIGANTYQQLTTSTLNQVRKVWQKYFFWHEGIHYVVGIQPPKEWNVQGHTFDSYDSIISFRNSGIIFKGSLDNYKVHEGKELGWADIDETKDTKEEAITEVILPRLRQRGFYNNPLGLFTSPAKVDWINKWFNLDEYEAEIMSVIHDRNNYFKKTIGDKFVNISSTYHNEKNLPDGFIDGILKNNSKEAGERLIFGNPFVKTGGEYFKTFDHLKHIKPTPYIPELPIHLSFDQNKVPYATCVCMQLQKIDGIDYLRIFDEICLESPHNSTEGVCREFERRYGSMVKGLFYYGDPSGQYQNAKKYEEEETHYNIIERILRRYLNNGSRRIATSFPPAIAMRDFSNNILANVYNIRVQVDPRCRNMIADFDFTKEDENGHKLKVRTRDHATGLSFEKYGHTGDCFEYCICELFKHIFLMNFKK